MHIQKWVKFIDNTRRSTWQTDGLSNLPDRHCLLISDLMITVCESVCVYLCLVSKDELNKSVLRGPLLTHTCVCVQVFIQSFVVLKLFYSCGLNASVPLSSWNWGWSLINGWPGLLWQADIPELYLACVLVTYQSCLSILSLNMKLCGHLFYLSLNCIYWKMKRENGWPWK